MTVSDSSNRASSVDSVPHPHGSTVEQVHRILTSDAYRDMDPWMLAEEIVRFVSSHNGSESAGRKPTDPKPPFETPERDV